MQVNINPAITPYTRPVIEIPCFVHSRERHCRSQKWKEYDMTFDVPNLCITPRYDSFILVVIRGPLL